MKSASRIGARHSPLRGSGIIKWVLNRCKHSQAFPVSKAAASAKSATPFRVELPARLIVAGGWSDCCPMAIVKPGGVVNLAIKVEGSAPCQAWCGRQTGGGGLTFISDDLGVQRTFYSWDELYEEVLVDGGVEFGPANLNTDKRNLMLVNHDSPYSIFASVVVIMFDQVS